MAYQGTSAPNDNYIHWGDVHNPGTGDFSLVIRFRVTQSGPSRVICGHASVGAKTNGWFFYANSDYGRLYIGDGVLADKTVATSRTMTDSLWHTVVITFDRDGYMKLYLDGFYESQTDISSLASSDIDPGVNLMALNNPTYNSDNSAIEIGELAIYNRAMTGDEAALIGTAKGAIAVVPGGCQFSVTTDGDYDDSVGPISGTMVGTVPSATHPGISYTTLPAAAQPFGVAGVIG